MRVGPFQQLLCAEVTLLSLAALALLLLSIALVGLLWGLLVVTCPDGFVRVSRVQGPFGECISEIHVAPAVLCDGNRLKVRVWTDKGVMLRSLTMETKGTAVVDQVYEDSSPLPDVVTIRETASVDKHGYRSVTWTHSIREKNRLVPATRLLADRVGLSPRIELVTTLAVAELGGSGIGGSGTLTWVKKRHVSLHRTHIVGRFAKWRTWCLLLVFAVVPVLAALWFFIRQEVPILCVLVLVIPIVGCLVFWVPDVQPGDLPASVWGWVVWAGQWGTIVLLVYSVAWPLAIFPVAFMSGSRRSASRTARKSRHGAKAG